MIRSLFLTTALVGIAGSAMAQSAHVGGSYAPVNGTVTLGAPLPTVGSAYGGTVTAQEPAMTYDTMSHTNSGGQYIEYAPAPAPVASPSVQTINAVPGTPQTFTVPGGQNATYNIVVPTAAAPAVSYAAPQPVYQEPAAAGWKAQGVYVGARAGITSQDDTDFTTGRRHGYPGVNVQSTYEEPGYTGSLVAGYGVRSKSGWGYRVEVEGGYQTNEIDSHRVLGQKFSGNDALGETKVLYGFVNAYGDVALTERLALTAGGGAGLGHIEFDSFGVRGPGTVLDDSATAFGYHLDAGISYQLTDKVAVEALYRYQQFIDAEVTTVDGDNEKIDLENHSILAGVRVGL